MKLQLSPANYSITNNLKKEVLIQECYSNIDITKTRDVGASPALHW